MAYGIKTLIDQIRAIENQSKRPDSGYYRLPFSHFAAMADFAFNEEGDATSALGPLCEAYYKLGEIPDGHYDADDVRNDYSPGKKLVSSLSPSESDYLPLLLFLDHDVGGSASDPNDQGSEPGSSFCYEDYREALYELTTQLAVIVEQARVRNPRAGKLRNIVPLLEKWATRAQGAAEDKEGLPSLPLREGIYIAMASNDEVDTDSETCETCKRILPAKHWAEKQGVQADDIRLKDLSYADIEVSVDQKHPNKKPKASVKAIEVEEDEKGKLHYNEVALKEDEDFIFSFPPEGERARKRDSDGEQYEPIFYEVVVTGIGDYRGSQVVYANEGKVSVFVEVCPLCGRQMANVHFKYDSKGRLKEKEEEKSADGESDENHGIPDVISLQDFSLSQSKSQKWYWSFVRNVSRQEANSRRLPLSQDIPHTKQWRYAGRFLAEWLCDDTRALGSNPVEQSEFIRQVDKFVNAIIVDIFSQDPDRSMNLIDLQSELYNEYEKSSFGGFDVKKYQELFLSPMLSASLFSILYGPGRLSEAHLYKNMLSRGHRTVTRRDGDSSVKSRIASYNVAVVVSFGGENFSRERILGIYPIKRNTSYHFGTAPIGPQDSDNPTLPSEDQPCNDEYIAINLVDSKISRQAIIINLVDQGYLIANICNKNGAIHWRVLEAQFEGLFPNGRLEMVECLKGSVINPLPIGDSIVLIGDSWNVRLTPVRHYSAPFASEYAAYLNEMRETSPSRLPKTYASFVRDQRAALENSSSGSMKENPINQEDAEGSVEGFSLPEIKNNIEGVGDIDEINEKLEVKADELFNGVDKAKARETLNEWLTELHASVASFLQLKGEVFPQTDEEWYDMVKRGLNRYQKRRWRSALSDTKGYVKRIYASLGVIVSGDKRAQ